MSVKRFIMRKQKKITENQLYGRDDPRIQEVIHTKERIDVFRSDQSRSGGRGGQKTGCRLTILTPKPPTIRPPVR